MTPCGPSFGPHPAEIVGENPAEQVSNRRRANSTDRHLKRGRAIPKKAAKEGPVWSLVSGQPLLSVARTRHGQGTHKRKGHPDSLVSICLHGTRGTRLGRKRNEMEPGGCCCLEEEAVLAPWSLGSHPAKPFLEFRGVAFSGCSRRKSAFRYPRRAHASLLSGPSLPPPKLSVPSHVAATPKAGPPPKSRKHVRTRERALA